MLGLKNIIPPSVVQYAAALQLLDGSSVLLGVVGTRVRVYRVHGTSASCPPSRHRASDAEAADDTDFSGFLSTGAFADVCASDTVEELWDELEIGGAPLCLQPLANQCFVVITSDSDVVVARYQANLDAPPSTPPSGGGMENTSTTPTAKELAWAVLLRKAVLGCASTGRRELCAEPRIVVSDAGDVAACHIFEGELHIVTVRCVSVKGGGGQQQQQAAPAPDSSAMRIRDSKDSDLIELPLLDKSDVSEAMDEELLLHYSPIDLIAMKRGTKPYPDYFLKKLAKNATTRGVREAHLQQAELPTVRFYSIKNDKLSNVRDMIFVPSPMSPELNSPTSRSDSSAERYRNGGLNALFGYHIGSPTIAGVSESLTSQIRRLVPLQGKSLLSSPLNDYRNGRDAGRLAVISRGSRNTLWFLDIPAWTERDRKNLANTRPLPLSLHMPYLMTCDWLPSSADGSVLRSKEYRALPPGTGGSASPTLRSLLTFSDNGDGFQYLLRAPLRNNEPQVAISLARSSVRVSAAVWTPHYPHYQRWRQQMQRRKEKNMDVCTAESDSFFSAISFPPSTLHTAAPSFSSSVGAAGTAAGDAQSRGSDLEELPEQFPAGPLEDDHVVPPQRELWLMLSDGGIVVMSPEQLTRSHAIASSEGYQSSVEDWKRIAIEGLPYSFSPVFMLPYGGVGCIPLDSEGKGRTASQLSHRTDVTGRWILLGDRWSGVYVVDTLFRRVAGRLISNGWMTGVALDRDHILYTAHVNGVVKRIVPTFTPETLCAAPTFENINHMIPLRSRQKCASAGPAVDPPGVVFLAVGPTRNRPICITSSSFEEVQFDAGVVYTDEPTLAVYQWDAYVDSKATSASETGGESVPSLYPLLQCTRKGIVYQGNKLSFQDLGFGNHVATHAYFYNQHLLVAAYGNALGVVRVNWDEDESLKESKKGKSKRDKEDDGDFSQESSDREGSGDAHADDPLPQKDGFLYNRPPNSLEVMQAKLMDAEVCCVITVPLYSTTGTRHALEAESNRSGKKDSKDDAQPFHSGRSVAKRMMALMAVVVGFWNETVVVYTGLDLTPHRTLRTHSVPRMLVNLEEIGFITVSLDNGQVVLWDGIAPHSGNYYVSGAADGVPYTSRHVFCQDLENWKPTGRKAWCRTQERHWKRVLRKQSDEKQMKKHNEHDDGEEEEVTQADGTVENASNTPRNATTKTKANKKSTSKKRSSRPEESQKATKKTKVRAAKKPSEKEPAGSTAAPKGPGGTNEQAIGDGIGANKKSRMDGVLYPLNDDPPVIVLYDSHGTSSAPTVIPCIDYKRDYYYTGADWAARMDHDDDVDSIDEDDRVKSQILIIAENEAQFIALNGAGVTYGRSKVLFDVPPATHVSAAVALHVSLPPSEGASEKSPQKSLFVALSCNDGHIRVCPLVNLTTDGSVASLRPAPQRSRVERTTCIRTCTNSLPTSSSTDKAGAAAGEQQQQQQQQHFACEPAGMLTHMIHLPAALSLLAVTLGADGVSSLVGIQTASLIESDRLSLTMNGGESVACLCRARHSFPLKSEDLIIGSVSVQTPSSSSSTSSGSSLSSSTTHRKGHIHVVSAFPLRVRCTIETPSGPVYDVAAFHKRRKGVRQDYVAVACGSSVCVYVFVGAELQLACSTTFSQPCISVSFTGTYLSCGLENTGVVLVQFIAGYGKKTAMVHPVEEAAGDAGLAAAPSSHVQEVGPRAPQGSENDAAHAPKKQIHSAAAPNDLKANSGQWFDLSRHISEPLDSHTVVKQARLNEDTIVRIDTQRNVEVVKIERATDGDEIAAHNFFTESLGNVVGMTGGSSSALDACVRLPSTPCAVLVSQYAFNKVGEHTPTFFNFNPEMEGSWSVARTTRNVLIACQDGSLWSLSGMPVEQSRLLSRIERCLGDGLRVFSKAERWCRSSDRETGSAPSGGAMSATNTKRIRVSSGVEVGRAFRSSHRVLRSRNVISMDLVLELLHVYERWRDFEEEEEDDDANRVATEKDCVSTAVPAQRCQPSPHMVSQWEREFIREKYEFFTSLLQDDETLQLESEQRVSLDTLASVLRFM